MIGSQLMNNEKSSINCHLFIWKMVVRKYDLFLPLQDSKLVSQSHYNWLCIKETAEHYNNLVLAELLFQNFNKAF